MGGACVYGSGQPRVRGKRVQEIGWGDCLIAFRCPRGGVNVFDESRVHLMDIRLGYANGQPDTCTDEVEGQDREPGRGGVDRQGVLTSESSPDRETEMTAVLY